MRRKHLPFPTLLLGLAALAAFAAAPARAQAPQIAWSSDSLAASGFSPDGAIVWFGVERSIDPDFSADILSHRSTTQAAADGSSLLDLDRKLAERAVWVAVDLATGAWAATSPTGYALEKLAAPPVSVQSRTAAASDALTDSRSYLLGLLVRPQVGAWSFGGSDGGPADSDGATDGLVTFALDALDPVGAGPAAPARAATEDLCFVIDPLTLDLSVLLGGVPQ
jgi:hypothetical protein